MSPAECLICSPFAVNGWIVALVAFVAVTIFLAVGGGRIIGIWLCDPVGPGLPLLAWIIVFAAPQMADMLAGMNSTLGGETPTLWRMLELGIGVLLLGVQGWCWTRAAHNARLGFTDDTFIANAGIAPALTWQDRAAPRRAWYWCRRR
jgi:energy-coupling factor transporter transmembrane protein EcfT